MKRKDENIFGIAQRLEYELEKLKMVVQFHFPLYLVCSLCLARSLYLVKYLFCI